MRTVDQNKARKTVIAAWLAAVWLALRHRWLLTGASIVLGAGAGLAASSRLAGFWSLSRLPRLVTSVISGVLLAGLAALLLWQAWKILLAMPRRLRIISLLAVCLAGAAVQVSGIITPSLPPQHYRLEIEGQGEFANDRAAVHLIEIRGPSDRALEPDEVQVEGSWQREGIRGFILSGKNTGRLSLVFFDQPGKKLHLLFEEQPEASQALVRLDQQAQQVNLSGETRGIREIELTLPRKPSRWDVLLFTADLITWLVIFPLLLLVVGSFASRQVTRFQPIASAWGNQIWIYYPGIFVALFIGLLLLPLAGFPGSLDKFERNFWGSRQLLWAYSAFRERILQDIYFNEVIRGRDGWLIYSSPQSMDDFQNMIPFRDDELEKLRQKLDTTNAQLAQAGIEFLVYVAPNKNTIYPDDIPEQIPVIGSQSRLDQVIDYQKRHGQTQVLDLRPALFAARDELDGQGRRLYLKTDTHWNAFGALVGYQQVMLALQDRFPELVPKSLSDFDIPPGNLVLGDMGNRWVPSAQPEEWVGLERRDPGRWKRYNISDEMPVRVLTYQPGPELPKAIIYHDSFMMWQYEYFAEHFREAHFIWSYAVDFDFVSGEKPDIVILEVTERYLPSLLIDGGVVDEPNLNE